MKDFPFRLKFVVGPQACSVSDQISRESSIISTNSHREGSKVAKDIKDLLFLFTYYFRLGGLPRAMTP